MLFDVGLMGKLLKILFKVLKLLFKLFKFTGTYWIIVAMAPFILIEETSGKVIKVGSILDIISYPFIYIALACMVFTTIQNIVRIFKKDRSFNIFMFILENVTGRQAKVGFVAKLNLDKINNVSGMVFGKIKRKYVTKKEQEDGHSLIIGGQGSGKSSCIAIPTLLSWKNRAFVIDIKGELHEKTKKTRGEDMIKVFNPSDVTVSGYNPYYLLEDTDDLGESVKEIAQAIIPLSADTKEPMWIQNAQDFLTGTIIHFYDFGMNFSETMIAIKSKPCQELVAEIMNSGNQDAIVYISTFSGMSEKTLSGIFAEVSRCITPFATNKSLIRALNGTGSCITPQDLEDGYDIFICIEEHKLEQWKSLMTMMVNQFCKFFEKRKNDNKTPILFLLDEFPRLGKIESVATGLTTLRSKKIEIMLIIQSKAQLDLIYGKDNAINIADNCNYKCILKASEPNTQKWCSDLVGTYDKKKTSSNYNADMVGIGKGTGTSTTTEEKRIIKPEEFAYLKDIVCIFPTGYSRIEKASIYDKRNYFNQLITQQQKHN